MVDDLNQGEQPKVSVVIPCRWDAHYLEECVGSLADGAYPTECLEILIVDGEQSQNVREATQRLRERYPFVKLLTNSRAHTPAGLNLGVKAANGEVIIIAGAHAKYGEDFIGRNVAALLKHDADCAGGHTVTVPPRPGAVAEAIASALSCRFGVGNSRFRVSAEPGFVDTVPYGAYRREVFDQVGLFDERLLRNQDIEFNYRLRRGGKKVYMSSDITSYYYCRGTLRGLWEQSFANGKWNIYTLALAGPSLSCRHFVPLAFVVSLLLSALSLPWLKQSLWILVGILGAYAFAASVAAMVSPRGKYRAGRVWLPFVFLTLHLSYGLGSLWGILTLWTVCRDG